MPVREDVDTTCSSKGALSVYSLIDNHDPHYPTGRLVHAACIDPMILDGGSPISSASVRRSTAGPLSGSVNNQEYGEP